jgi:type III pantothenate kinase
MPTTLCFDFGNTRCKYAVFINDQFQKEYFLTEPTLPALQKVYAEYQPTQSILSSVIDLPNDVLTFLEAQKCLMLNHETKLPFSIAYESAKTLGKDRIALVAGMQQIFPNQNSLVISAGTCITYTFINAQNQLLGGGISPGVHMRLQAMHKMTDQLPLAEPSPVFSMIGFNTKQSLVTGTMQGILLEMQGTLALYAQQYSLFNAVLTGGDAGYFAPHLKNLIFAAPEILYRGLNAICAYNK